MFDKKILNNGTDLKTNYFTELCETVHFEKITKERQGANLVQISTHSPKNIHLIPIVRTTTSYSTPNQLFSLAHLNLIHQIQQEFPQFNIEPNNALIEIYGNHYGKMGYHSDQALDLKEESFICLFSCYNNPQTKNIRTLRIKEKNSNVEQDILLDHNSVVVFSTKTNSNYLHKIILTNPDHKSETDLWLGITFRQSKTFIYFQENIPYFLHNSQPLFLASKEQSSEFYKYKKVENTNSSWEDSSPINYTLSKGDLIPI
jgi:hypothetical protein